MKISNTIYMNFTKHIVSIVFFCMMGIGMVQAGTDYDIIFKNSANDNEYMEPRYSLEEILGNQTQNRKYIKSIDQAINVHNSKYTLALGVRIGDYNETGSLIMTFADNCQINASKIVFRMAQYYGHEGHGQDEGNIRVTITYTDNSTSSVEFETRNLTSERDTVTKNYTMRLIPEKQIKTVALKTLTANCGRVYCKNFRVYSAPILTPPEVSDITKTTATLKSMVTDLGSPDSEINKGYGFVISSTHTTPTITNYEQKEEAGTTYYTINTVFSEKFEGLIPGTTYYARSYVTTNESANGWNTHSAKTTTFNTKGHVATFVVGDHGTCGTTSIEEFPNSAGITLPDVTPNSGYRFAGWSPTSNDATDTIEAGTHYDLTDDDDDITFYAVCIQQFNVQWLVDGKEYRVGEPTTIVDYGSKVTQLPSPPSPADQCGQAFVGWISTPITATQDGPPTDLFTTAEGSPTIKENTTFYAVFADITQ